MEDNRKPTTVGGIPTGGMTESGNPSHNPDGTFGSEENMQSNFAFDFNGSEKFDFLNNLNLDGAEEFDFLDDIDLQNQIENTIERNYNSHLALRLGRDHYDKITDLVEQCGNNNVIKFWKKYYEGIVVRDAKYTGRAQSTSNGIYFNINKDSLGSSFLAPYETLFHEGGHAIDRNLREEKGLTQNTNYLGWHFSARYKDGLFPITIQNEINDLVKLKHEEMKLELQEAIKNKDWVWLYDNNLIYTWQFEETFNGIEPKDFKKIKISKERAYAKVQEEIMKNTTYLGRANLSDMFEGATYGRIDMGVGHGKSYWRDGTPKDSGINTFLATEAFTEMFSSIIANKESLENIKKYLPKSYKVFEEMIEVLTK